MPSARQLTTWLPKTSNRGPLFRWVSDSPSEGHADERNARLASVSSRARETALTVIVFGVWAVTSDLSGWFSGWRRADSRLLRRLLGLTGKASVARRRPRTAGVT